MTRDEYLKRFAKQLVAEMRQIVDLPSVTRNTDLLGAYTEAAIRRLIARVVYPMHVSRGAVLDFPLPKTVPQTDVIVWAPYPAPAIFQVEDFALVPRGSAFGVLEIKRSNKGNAVAELEKFVESAVTRVADAGIPSVKGDWQPLDQRERAVLGIISVLEKKPSARLRGLMAAGKIAAIFDKTSGERRIKVRTNGVVLLINTLHYISWRYRWQSASPNSIPMLVEVSEPEPSRVMPRRPR